MLRSFIKSNSSLLKSEIFRIKIYRTMSQTSNIIEKKILVGDTNINFVQSGTGNKSLLLMPGALGSAWTDFKPQIELLPKILNNYTIIAWDPPGYGKSIPPKRNFSLDFFYKDAEFARQLMINLNRSKFSILGWSDGGITALILAGKNPSNVEKLVIWGAGAYINDDEMKVLEGIRDVNKWSPRMREPMENVYGKDRFAELWSEWIDGVSEIHKKNNGNFCMAEAESIKLPTLIVHGKKDPMIAAEHIPWLREKINGNIYHEFPEGKHNIHLRYADEFNKIVEEFLRN